ncbi:inter-alpha-trypsin inhibitor heavy chain H4-like [Homalodisca vitripennis]|uniref:inter-alpha-trypsin inhibitor heavy chain H4-like n=1 Tax=Homalodisca vitripennis TaxID=197043 RepID=UPI001EECA134|nr:inter-alpha-trypsin inhibitor heavy chain H4-like [Homalodisca vitripennis]
MGLFDNPATFGTRLDSLDNTEERNQTKEEKALNLALQYSFVTPLTSLVVVKPNETESVRGHNTSETWFK